MAKNMTELADRVIQTDFLIIGGGLVGSMAAIRAKKNDPNVDITLIDKAKMEYAGDGVGLDNFNMVPLHKEDMYKDYTEEDASKATFGANRLHGLVNPRLDAISMRNAYISMPLLEEIGVRVREDDGALFILQAYRRGVNWGRVEYEPNGEPCEPRFGSLSRGSDLKKRLGAAVRKNGTHVLDRTMITSIVTNNGAAVGATAINTRTNEFIFIQAKAVLISTGQMARLYPYQWAPFPNNLFYSVASPVNHGGGHIAALNAGARLVTMDMCNVYNVTKGVNHSSGGGGCNWFFRMYNSKGEALEDKYPERMVTKIGGTIPGVNYLFGPNIENAEVLRDVILSYKDKAEPDTQNAVYFTAATEPPRALKFHKLAGGLTNEKPSECVCVLTGLTQAGNGILRETEASETCVKNLYAAGACVGAGGSAGFTWACLVADHVTEVLKETPAPVIGTDQVHQAEKTKRWVYAPYKREGGYTVDPLEMEDYIRRINLDYVGLFKYTSKMKRGLELLERVRDHAVPQLTADTPHELMRAIEAQQILEISQMHIQSSLMREESRLVPVHYRVEFPERDPKWENMVIQCSKQSGQTKYEIVKLSETVKDN